MNAMMKLFLPTAIFAAGCVGPDAETGSGWPVTDEPTEQVEAGEILDDPSVEDAEIDDLAVADPVVDEPAVDPYLTCVSDFVHYDGRHYVWRFGAPQTAPVQLSYVTPPTGLQLDELGGSVETVVATWDVDVAPAHFGGFEQDDASVRVAEPSRRGWFEGSMHIPADEDGSLLVADDVSSISVTCFMSDLELGASYEDGKCLNSDGLPDLNDVDFRYVHHTGNGECADLSSEALNGDALGYPVFVGLDLRGALLEGSTLYFASIAEARLEGADLRDFEFGYAIVEGSTDEHTQTPEGIECVSRSGEEPTSDGFRCMR